MSRSIDLFIDTDCPLDEVAGAIRSRCEVGITADPDRGRWVVQEGEGRAVLGRHGFVDDGELPLSHYPYALSARVASGRPQDSAEAALLRRIGHRLQEQPGWSVLLVLDLQYRDGRGAEGDGPGTSGAGTGEDGSGEVGSGEVGSGEVGSGEA